MPFDADHALTSGCTVLVLLRLIVLILEIDGPCRSVDVRSMVQHSLRPSALNAQHFQSD